MRAGVLLGTYLISFPSNPGRPALNNVLPGLEASSMVCKAIARLAGPGRVT